MHVWLRPTMQQHGAHLPESLVLAGAREAAAPAAASESALGRVCKSLAATLTCTLLVIPDTPDGKVA